MVILDRSLAEQLFPSDTMPSKPAPGLGVKSVPQSTTKKRAYTSLDGEAKLRKTELNGSPKAHIDQGHKKMKLSPAAASLASKFEIDDKKAATTTMAHSSSRVEHKNWKRTPVAGRSSLHDQDDAKKAFKPPTAKMTYANTGHGERKTELTPAAGSIARKVGVNTDKSMPIPKARSTSVNTPSKGKPTKTAPAAGQFSSNIDDSDKKPKTTHTDHTTVNTSGGKPQNRTSVSIDRSALLREAKQHLKDRNINKLFDGPVNIVPGPSSSRVPRVQCGWCLDLYGKKVAAFMFAVPTPSTAHQEEGAGSVRFMKAASQGERVIGTLDPDKIQFYRCLTNCFAGSDKLRVRHWKNFLRQIYDMVCPNQEPVLSKSALKSRADKSSGVHESIEFHEGGDRLADESATPSTRLALEKGPARHGASTSTSASDSDGTNTSQHSKVERVRHAYLPRYPHTVNDQTIWDAVNENFAFNLDDDNTIALIKNAWVKKAGTVEQFFPSRKVIENSILEVGKGQVDRIEDSRSFRIWDLQQSFEKDNAVSDGGIDEDASLMDVWRDQRSA